MNACFTKEKRDVRCSHRRVLLLNCAWKPTSGMLFKRINVISTLRGNFVSSVCPIQTIQRAKTRHIKTRTKTKTSLTRRRKTQRERERERERERIKQTQSNNTTYHFIRISEGKILVIFYCVCHEKEKKRSFFISREKQLHFTDLFFFVIS